MSGDPRPGPKIFVAKRLAIETGRALLAQRLMGQRLAWTAQVSEHAPLGDR